MSFIRVAGVKLLAMKHWAARTFLVPTTITILRWPPEANDGPDRSLFDRAG